MTAKELRIWWEKKYPEHSFLKQDDYELYSLYYERWLELQVTTLIDTGLLVLVEEITDAEGE